MFTVQKAPTGTTGNGLALFIVADGMGGHAVGEKVVPRCQNHLRQARSRRPPLVTLFENAGINAIGTESEFRA